jgi:hypoxanthine-guanine phosphoribosyltransferase
MHQDIKEILISQEQLDRRVSELAEVIQKEYHDKKPW